MIGKIGKIGKVCKIGKKSKIGKIALNMQDCQVRLSGVFQFK